MIALFLSLNVDEFSVAETMVPARYYLRLAWFLREVGEVEQHTVKASDLERSLASAKEFWPEVPTSERVCRERAIELYTKALSNSRSIDTARDEVELILLIGRLYMSIGELGEARAFIDRARASTRKFEQDKSTSERGGLPEATVIEMGRDLRLMERMNEDVRKLFDDIKTEVREAQLKLAEPLLAAHAGQSPAALREILQKHGVEPEFAREFAPDPKPQAKGFFGSLFK
jgi:tetratricopeptide (TPR) repeat protein